MQKIDKKEVIKMIEKTKAEIAQLEKERATMDRIDQGCHTRRIFEAKLWLGNLEDWLISLK